MTDVGGSTVTDRIGPSLSNISLRWMVHEVMKSQVGILFDELALLRASISVPTFPGMPIENIPKEAELNSVDAFQPIHDRLKISPIWWLLEFVMFRQSWQDVHGVWHRKFR